MPIAHLHLFQKASHHVSGKPSLKSMFELELRIHYLINLVLSVIQVSFKCNYKE